MTIRSAFLAILLVASAPLAAQVPCPAFQPVPLAPLAGETSGLVTFRWTGLDDDVRVPFDAQPEYVVGVVRGESDPLFVATTRDTRLTRFLPPGIYQWAVSLVVRGCRPTISRVVPFRVPQRADCPATPPALLAPAGGAALGNAEVALQWSAVPGADAYQVWLQRDPDAPFRAAFTRRTDAALDLPEGGFVWRVEALTSGCAPLSSSRSSFSVLGCELDRPIAIAPPNGFFGLPSPVAFEWSEVEDAEGYRVWARFGGGLLDSDSEPVLLGTTDGDSDTKLEKALPNGPFEWWVEAIGEDGCRSRSAVSTVTVLTLSGCPEPRAPHLAVPKRVTAGQSFRLVWTPVPGSASYEIEESTNEDFAGAVALPPAIGTSLVVTKAVVDDTRFHYRIRSVSGCAAARSEWSEAVAVDVVRDVESLDATAGVAATGTLDLCLFGGRLARCGGAAGGDNDAPVTLSLASDRPFLTVAPASLTIPPRGKGTVTVTAARALLPSGTTRGALTAAVAGKVEGHAGGGSVSVSLTLVTPVAAAPASPASESTLIVPAVAHTDGLNSTWESDVRLLNASPSTARYEIAFTPSNADGTVAGERSEVDVAAGATLALDDVLESWYGATAATGSLSIRPLFDASAADAATPGSVASSRTFNVLELGTFGQFMPAIPFSRFTRSGSSISLQQLSQTTDYRTNIGLVEGAGESAAGTIDVYAASGSLVTSIPWTLAARQHTQLNSPLGEYSLSDMRLEVRVTSATGRVSAYASRIDNRTGDPYVVYPSAAGSSGRWVVPGVSALDTGLARWRTDVRVHNAGSATASLRMTFYPQGDPASPLVADVSVPAGEMKAFDDVLVTTFGLASGGGAIHVEPAGGAPSQPLTVTAQTYNVSETGTYGQFIPGITAAEAVGVGERTLQLLQVEESDRFRTNLGLAEVSGQGVTVEISAVVPESRVTPKATITLLPNEFRQLTQVIRQLNLPSTYNGRIAVRAVSGGGRVTAYASMIDNVTQDPTYVPAQ